MTLWPYQEVEPVLIDCPPKVGDGIRAVKAKIPGELYVQLHAVKLLTGIGISEAITDALRMYLDHIQETYGDGRGLIEPKKVPSEAPILPA